MKTQILFYRFETKKKPGKIIAHGIRFETIELDSADGVLDETTFKILCEDNVDPNDVNISAFKAAVSKNFPSH